ncbi:hypothetical protein XB05_17395 [Xanthomonas arboricola]|nr:hypothetical protein XB05_17395 [Xanthomonas arboricola]
MILDSANTVDNAQDAEQRCIGRHLQCGDNVGFVGRSETAIPDGQANQRLFGPTARRGLKKFHAIVNGCVRALGLQPDNKVIWSHLRSWLMKSSLASIFKRSKLAANGEGVAILS